MPTPQGIETVTLHGRFVEPDLVGTPLSGSVTFSPNVPMVNFPNENTLMAGTESVTLDANGEFTIDLPCTNTPGQNPSGWAYTVTEKLIGPKTRTYSIFLPATQLVLELSDIIPTEAAPTYLPVQGAPGVIQSINGISQAAVTLTAANVGAVATTGAETVAGVKTFSSILVLPGSDPTTSNQATRKSYVDALDGANVKLTGDQTITGTKSISRARLTDTTDVSLSSTQHAFQIGADGATNLRMDANEIMAVSNGVESTLHINPDGGNLTHFNNRSSGSTVDTLTVKGNASYHGVVTGMVSPTAVDHLTRKDYVDLGVSLWKRRDFPDPVVADSLYSGTAPTITVAMTSTPTSGYIKQAPSGVTLSGTDVTGPFSYLGAGGFQIGSGTPDSTYVLPTSRYPNTRGSLTSSQAVWSLEFGTDAQIFQLRFNYQTAGMYRLSIDGRKVTDLMQAVGGTTAGNTHLMTVDFGSATPRVVRFDFYTVPFGGIYLPPTATMWATTSKGGRLMVLGDSISDGSAENTGAGHGTWFHRFARLMGSNDYWDEGRGGTGYISPGTSPVYATFGDRAAVDVIAWAPDRLIIWGGYNDNGGSQSAIGAAADSLYAAIKTGLPKTQVFVIGCFSPTGSPGASITNTDTTIRTSAATAGFPFVSPITGSIYDRTGALVTTQGAWITAANAAGYIGSDSIHPNNSGHIYLSRRISNAIRQMILP